MPMQPEQLCDVALAVIAGGAGSRMGRPKIELLLDGKPILHALLDRMGWLGPTVASVAAGQAGARGLDRFDRVVLDGQPGEGPLRGLHGVLTNSPAPYVAVLAVDMPFVQRRHLAWLATQLKGRPEAKGLMIVRATPDGTSRIEPFPSAFRRDFAETVALRLSQNRRALRGLAEEKSVQTVAPPPWFSEQTWTNLNTPDDVTAFQRAGDLPRR